MKRNEFLFTAAVTMFFINCLVFAQDTTLTITNTGYVGIGTTSPATSLHVAGTGWAGIDIQTLSSGGAIGSYLNFADLDDRNVGAILYDHSTDQMEFKTNDVSHVAITSSGNVGIGTTSPAAKLHVNGTAGNNTGVWSNLSDRRLKTNIEPIRAALSTVEQLKGVTFHWKDEKKDAEYGRIRGLIAQDVEKVIPEWVKTDPDGYKRLEPIGIDALLISAIKELDDKVEEIQTLREENQKLSARLTELESLVKTIIVEKETVDGKSMAELR